MGIKLFKDGVELADLPTVGRPVASEAEAIAGTDNLKQMTALRTAQAIAALGGDGDGLELTTEPYTGDGNAIEITTEEAGLGDGAFADFATQPEAETGTDNTKVMTPLRTKQAIEALGGGGVFSGARVTNSADQTISGGAATALNFDTDVYDVGGYHDTTANTTRMTMSSTGYYSAVGHVTIPGVGGTLQLSIRRNGTDYLAAFQRPGDTVNNNELMIVTDCHLTGGDYLELCLFTSDGADVKSFANYSPVFCIRRLG
jgi:hypothetical protein